MENPFEIQQNVLLGRIATNIRKLNEVLEDAQLKLHHINSKNEEKINKLSAIFKNYHRSVAVHLENENQDFPDFDSTEDAQDKASRHNDMSMNERSGFLDETNLLKKGGRGHDLNSISHSSIGEFSHREH